MAVHGAIDPAEQYAVVKGGVFRRFGRAMVLAAAALATALLMSPTASAQLYTSGTFANTVNWDSNRWSTSSSGPFNSGFVSGSNTIFNTGTFNIANLTAGSGTTTLGNLTTTTSNTVAIVNQLAGVAKSLSFVNTGTITTAANSLVNFGFSSIAGTNSIRKEGLGTLALVGGGTGNVPTYTGGLTINGGTVIATSTNALGSGTVTIASSGGTIGSGRPSSAGTTTLKDFSTRVSSLALNGDLRLGASGTLAFNTDAASMTFGNVALGGSGERTLTIGSSGTQTISGTLSGANVLRLESTGTGTSGLLVFSGTSTYSGGTKIGDVVLQASGSGTVNVLGTGTVSLTGTTASTLRLTDGLTLTNAFNIGDTAGVKTISTTGNATISGAVATAETTPSQFILGASSAKTLAVSGDISGAGGLQVGGTGLDGTVTLSGSNTYSGGTTLTAGTLGVSNASALGTGNLAVHGGTLDLFGRSIAVAALSGSSGGIITSSTTGAVTLTGSSASDSNFAGSIQSGSGTVALVKQGAGTLTLSGSSNYTGGTTLTAGTLALGSANAIGSSGTISFGGGTLQSSASNTTDYSARFSNAASQQVKIDTNGQNVTLASNLTSSGGSFEKLGLGTVTLSGTNTYSGGTTVSAGSLVGTTTSLQGAITNNAAVTFDQSTSGTYAGVMSGNGSLTKLGGGAVTLTGANTYSGATTVSAGSLVGTTTSLQGAIANNAAVTFDQSTAGTYAGVMSGNGSLTKIGAGAVTLTGANTYSGATTVSAGTLLVNGSLANSAVTVGNGGTLGGSGTLGALLTVQSGGVLSPGNSPGILAAAALDLEAGSTTFIEVIGNGANAGVAGTGYDQIQITTSGGLKYGGGLNLNFGNSSQFLNGTVFDLFAFSGTPIGHFSAVTSTGTGLYAGFNFSGSGGIWTSTIGDQLLTLSELTGRLTFSSSGGSVPEIDPATGSSALSLVAGVLAILEQRRWRRGSAPTLVA